MNIELGFSGNESRTLFKVVNPSKDQKIAIQFSVKSRAIDKHGKESRLQTSDFKVFPPQVILKPKETRNIRLSYKGKENGKKENIEKAYRLIASQVPLEFSDKEKKQTGIKILLKYVASVYLQPKSVKPQIEISLMEILKGGEKLKVLIRNSGKKHSILKKPKISMIKDKKEFILEGKDIEEIDSVNILAKSERIFEISNIANAKKISEINLKLDYK